MTVSVICVADRPERLPGLVWSLIAQTHDEWDLTVLDQSDEGQVDRYLRIPDRFANRIRVRPVERVGDWGYRAKHTAATTATGEALMFPQDDALYMPTALADMSAAMERGADLVLCGWLYDLFGYTPMPPAPRIGHVDVGGLLVRREMFLAHGWPDGDPQTTDGRFVERLMASGARLGTCPQVLYARS